MTVHADLHRFAAALTGLGDTETRGIWKVDAFAEILRIDPVSLRQDVRTALDRSITRGMRT
jgi:hypothetical protein